MKNKIRKLAEKYGMEILREPITREAWGVYIDSGANIPELDKLQEEMDQRDRIPASNEAVMTTEYIANTVRYKIICPTSWFDLYDWR